MAEDSIHIARVNTKGQFVIPKPIRDSLGIDKNTLLNIREENGRVRISKIKSVVEETPDSSHGTPISPELIEEISKSIVRTFSPERIILFGSHAWGMPTNESDIDILVIKDTKDRDSTARKIKSSLPKGVPADILVYSRELLDKKINRDRNLFLEDIINNGKVLYAS